MENFKRKLFIALGILSLVFTLFMVTKILLSNGLNVFSWSYVTSKIVSEGTIKTRVFTLDVLGGDSRIYIYKHPLRSNIECMQSNSSVSGGLSCYEIK